MKKRSGPFTSFKFPLQIHRKSHWNISQELKVKSEKGTVFEQETENYNQNYDICLCYSTFRVTCCKLQPQPNKTRISAQCVQRGVVYCFTVKLSTLTILHATDKIIMCTGKHQMQFCGVRDEVQKLI